MCRALVRSRCVVTLWPCIAWHARCTAGKTAVGEWERGKWEPAMTQDDAERQAARRAALSPLLASTEFRPLSASVKVEIGAHSGRGSSTRLNDDHYLVLHLGRHQQTIATSLSSADLPPTFDEHAYAMLVADGLGEDGAGAVASRVSLS